MGKIDDEATDFAAKEILKMAGKEIKESKLTVVKDEEKVEEKKKGPSPEEVEEYKQNFSKALKEFEERRWECSEPGNFGANDVGMYLLDFIKKYAFWSKTEWMGMIKMEEEIQKAMKLANAETPFQLSYQALEFCAYMLSNPGGTGIQLAKEFEAQAEKYSKIGIVVGTRIEEARKQLKELQFLQEKWAAGEQGFYYEREIEPETNAGQPVPMTIEKSESELEPDPGIKAE